MFRGSKESSIKLVEKPFKGTWINVVSPNKHEIDFLRDSLNIPTEFIVSAIDEEEQPRIDKEDKVKLIILKVPVIDEDEIITIPLGIILTEKNIITISTQRIPILNILKNAPKGFYTTKRTRFVLQILWLVVKDYIRHLRKIEKKIDEIEDRLNKNLSSDEILTIFQVQKTLTYFRAAVTGNGTVLEKISSGRFLRLYEEDQEILEDIVIENKQAMDMIKVYAIIAENMMTAYSTVMDTKLNNIMKILTSLSIILAIPTIISSFYGMNVLLPLQNHPHAFSILTILSILITSSLAYLLWKLGWF